MLAQDRLDDGPFGQRSGQGLLGVRLEVVHMKLQHVTVFDGVGDGVGVQLLPEDVPGGHVRGFLAVHLHVARVLAENRRAGKAEQLRVGKELLDGPVILAKLRAVAFVEDQHHAFLAQRFQPLPEIGVGAAVQRQPQLLNGRHDHLIGVVVRQQAAHQGVGVGVLFHAARLEAVEFLSGLPVQVFAVYHEQAFIDVGVVLEQRGRLEGSQGLAAAGGMPDVPVAAVAMNTVHDGPDRVNLVGAHHQQPLLALHQHHIPADSFGQGAFRQKLCREFFQMRDLFVVGGSVLIHRQIAFVGIK